MAVMIELTNEVSGQPLFVYSDNIVAFSEQSQHEPTPHHVVKVAGSYFRVRESPATVWAKIKQSREEVMNAE